LGRGVFNDETGGHIDNLACFVRPGEVCLTWTDRERDPQHASSLDAWQRLKDARDARGRRLRVTRLPMPGPLTLHAREAAGVIARVGRVSGPGIGNRVTLRDRKSTRLNSSHLVISYAVFCLKKKSFKITQIFMLSL